MFEWIDHLGLDAEVHVFTEQNAAGFRQIARRPLQSFRRHRQLEATEINPDDIVLIHREVSPLSDGQAEERLLRAGARSVVDLDDGLHWDWGQGGIARRLRPKAPKILRMVKAADLVIAGNDLIAEWAGQYAKRVIVIPSCVEPRRYRRKLDYELNDPPTIGWIGSGATEQYLDIIGDDLLWSRRRYGTRLEIVGADQERASNLANMINRIPWSEQATYEVPSSWDAAVMPLPDGLLERSKCGYKLLQYGAAGVSAVGSPIGVNTEICDHGPHELVGARNLSWLLEMPPSERRAIADRLAARVRDHFTFASNAAQFVDAIFGRQPITPAATGHSVDPTNEDRAVYIGLPSEASTQRHVEADGIPRGS